MTNKITDFKTLFKQTNHDKIRRLFEKLDAETIAEKTELPVEKIVRYNVHIDKLHYAPRQDVDKLIELANNI